MTIRVCSVIFILLIIFCTGCPEIPKETVELSQQLGVQIDSLHAYNIKLIHSYFDLKRKEIDEFMVEWTKIFKEDFYRQLRSKGTLSKLQTREHTISTVTTYYSIGSGVEKRIENRKASLLKPLNKLESKLVEAINTEFEFAKKMNATLTDFLVSANDVAESTNSVLNLVGVSKNKINGYINKIDNVLFNLVSTTKSSVSDYKDIGNKCIENLNDIFASINES